MPTPEWNQQFRANEDLIARFAGFRPSPKEEIEEDEEIETIKIDLSNWRPTK